MGGYGELSEKNIGVFLGSANSALLFIIYMGDMMEGNADLNGRSNLPTRIVPDRPQIQARQILWGTIRALGKTNEPLQEQQIIRTIKNTMSRQEMARNNTTDQLRRENAKETKTERHTAKMKMAKETKPKQQLAHKKKQISWESSFHTMPIDRSTQERLHSKPDCENPSK